jgi:hypothetical protein
VSHKIEERIRVFWRDAFWQIFKTPRDIKRVFNRFMLRDASNFGEVNAADMFALTVIEMFAPAVYKQILSRSTLYLDAQFGGVETNRFDQILVHGGSEEANKKAKLRLIEEIDKPLPEIEPLRSAIKNVRTLLFPRTTVTTLADSLGRSKGFVQNRYVFYIALRDELEQEYFPLQEARQFVNTRVAELQSLIFEICKNKRFYGLVHALQAINPHEFPTNRLPIWSKLTQAIDSPELQAEANERLESIRERGSLDWNRPETELVICIAQCEGTLQRHSGTGNFYLRQFVESNLTADTATFFGLVPGIMMWLEDSREGKAEVTHWNGADFESWNIEHFLLWKPSLIDEYVSLALFHRANAGGLLRCFAQYDNEGYIRHVAASWIDNDLFMQTARAFGLYLPNRELTNEDIKFLGGESLIVAANKTLENGNVSDPIVTEFCKKVVSRRE